MLVREQGALPSLLPHETGPASAQSWGAPGFSAGNEHRAPSVEAGREAWRGPDEAISPKAGPETPEPQSPASSPLSRFIDNGPRPSPPPGGLASHSFHSRDRSGRPTALGGRPRSRLSQLCRSGNRGPGGPQNVRVCEKCSKGTLVFPTQEEHVLYFGTIGKSPGRSESQLPYL